MADVIPFRCPSPQAGKPSLPGGRLDTWPTRKTFLFVVTASLFGWSLILTPLLQFS